MNKQRYLIEPRALIVLPISMDCSEHAFGGEFKKDTLKIIKHKKLLMQDISSVRVQVPVRKFR